MKFTGIVAPLALAGAVSAAAIPRADILQGATGELHSTLGSVNGLVNSLKGTASEADISQLTSLLKSINNKLDAQEIKVRQVDNLVEGSVDSALDTAGDAVETATGLKARGLGNLESTLQGVFSKIETGALTPQMLLNGLQLPVVQGLLSGPLSGILGNVQLSSLEPVVKGVFSKISSGALTPQMVVGALNMNTVEGLLAGPLSGVFANAQSLGLEPVLKSLFERISTGALTTQGLMGALNLNALQGLLNGPLSGVLGGLNVAGLQPIVSGVFSKISTGALTPQMIVGALNLNVLNGLLTGVLGGILGGVVGNIL